MLRAIFFCAPVVFVLCIFHLFFIYFKIKIFTLSLLFQAWYNLFNMKDLKLIIIAVCIFILAVVLMFYAAGKSNTKRAYGLYRQGLGFYAQKDYHNAYYNFSKISRFSKLYHIALLKQGQCALNVGDKKSAYSKFKHLGNNSHHVHLAPNAL